MKADDIKFLVLLAGVGVAGYLGWKTWRAGADALGGLGDTLSGWGDSLATAWDSATDVLAAPVRVITEGTASKVIAANITKPAVPVGGSSLQRRSVTDLPEGSYQAAAMFWSLYPDAVFYD